MTKYTRISDRFGVDNTEDLDFCLLKPYRLSYNNYRYKTTNYSNGNKYTSGYVT